MKDLVGEIYGHLIVKKLDHVKRYPKQTKAYWMCECVCGNQKVVRGEHLVSMRTVSCGCLAKNNAATHGLTKTPEYRAWLHMRARVTSKEPHKIKYYANIGIQESWDNFVEFLKDMGLKPSPKHELDRIDPYLPYCKENCRWATRSEQMQNTKRHYQ